MTSALGGKGPAATHRTETILMLAHCSSVKAIDLNIGKRRGLFKHDVVLGIASYRRVATRVMRAIELRHCGYAGNWPGERTVRLRRRRG